MAESHRRRSDSAELESESARELREKKRVLATLVVHDLRSPLAAVLGYLQLLREDLQIAASAPPTALEYIDEATQLVNKTLGLVATILDVDELEDGMLHAERQPVRVLDLFERARVSNRPHFDVRELAIDVDAAPDLVVALDRELFARVVENLLDNSTRYAPRRGRCMMLARRDGNDVEIAIGNTGPPVPMSDREQIFGRYFQVERRRASARANRGLGLYFCKLAVEAHGGTIHVEERGEFGAVFVVRVPDPPG